MNLKLKMNSTSKILKDHGLNEDGSANKFLRDTVDRLCDPYVPFSGNGSGMKANKTYPNNHSIKYISPYAHYQYTGILMLTINGSSYAKKGERKHYTGKSLKYQGAPKRGAKWERRMMNDKKNEVINDLQKFIKKGGK